MKTAHIVGVGMNAPTIQAEKIIESCEILIGAKKQLNAFKALGKPMFEGYGIEDVSRAFEETGAGSAAVLVSGDAGFFSGARELVSSLTGFEVRVTAGVPSVCDFFAKLQLPWQDAALISMHGAEGPLISAVRRNRLTFCLTGGNAPEIGAMLGFAGFGELAVHVGENLGYPDERIYETKAFQLGELSAMTVLLIVNENFDASVPAGIPDTSFIRAEGVPMTKSEIRAVVMSKLRIRPGDVCYDIGAGTGSVTVEMAMAAYSGRVYAIEREGGALALAGENCRKFHIGNVSLISGDAPEALCALPAPDAAFIGGSGGGFAAILDAVLCKNPDARVAATAISLETAHTALTEFEKKCLRDVEAVQIGVSRAVKRGGVHLLLAQNMVFIVCGGGKAACDDKKG